MLLLMLACTGSADTATTDDAAASGPDIHVEPTLIDAGTIPSGESVYIAFTIKNLGSENLEVLSASSDSAIVGLGSEIVPSPFYVVPGGSVNMLTGIGPMASTGSFSGDFTLHSNDPDEPEVVVTVEGWAE
jgi:hypothetical protein